MHRERIADDIYVFVSDLYAQATATVIATSEGAVVFDTLLYPVETQQIRRFIEARLNLPVKYVVNSHYHADHSVGTFVFSGARVISSALCRAFLDQRGRESLERSKAVTPELREAELVLPDLTFEGERFQLQCGGKTFEFWLTPGHSMDSMVCLVREDRVLLAADTVMPLPYFVDGSYDDFVGSLMSLRSGSYEHVVQGHGDVILRGEIEEKITSDLEYLYTLREQVDKALASKDADRALANIDIEHCGKDRILLNGAVERLHRLNVMTLASQRRELARM